MIKAAVAFIALVGFVQANSTQDVLEAEFRLFKVSQNKSYEDPSEEQVRLQIFNDNKRLIEEHNVRFEAGEESYAMGINQFTDLLPDEFEQLLLSSLDTSDVGAGIEYNYTASTADKIPESIDWRSKRAVTGVKNQGNCGSCWAFSATGTLESHNFIKTKKLVALSEQNLVDCTRGKPYNNYGCRGGWPATALQYIKDNKGINTEKSYRYEAKDGNCRFKKNSIGAKVVGIAAVPTGNESALAQAVANKGPVSVCIDASSFQHYKGGIFNEPSCGRNVNHAVVVVGYGKDKNGGDFWLVKNSWGTRWGEKGYIRMARNRKNQCKIATYGVFPLV